MKRRLSIVLISVICLCMLTGCGVIDMVSDTFTSVFKGSVKLNKDEITIRIGETYNVTGEDPFIVDGPSKDIVDVNGSYDHMSMYVMGKEIGKCKVKVKGYDVTKDKKKWSHGTLVVNVIEAEDGSKTYAEYVENANPHHYSVDSLVMSIGDAPFSVTTDLEIMSIEGAMAKNICNIVQVNLTEFTVEPLYAGSAVITTTFKKDEDTVVSQDLVVTINVAEDGSADFVSYEVNNTGYETIESYDVPISGVSPEMFMNIASIYMNDAQGLTYQLTQNSVNYIDDGMVYDITYEGYGKFDSDDFYAEYHRYNWDLNSTFEEQADQYMQGLITDYEGMNIQMQTHGKNACTFDCGDVSHQFFFYNADTLIILKAKPEDNRLVNIIAHALQIDNGDFSNLPMPEIEDISWTPDDADQAESPDGADEESAEDNETENVENESEDK